MSQNKPILKRELIGKCIRYIWHERPELKTEGFDEKLVVVELETGLRFSLQQPGGIVDSQYNLASIFPYFGPARFSLACVGVSQGDYQQIPIKAAVLPYGWQFSFGLVLNNGLILHDTFSEYGNGASLYEPQQEVIDSWVYLELPY